MQSVWATLILLATAIATSPDGGESVRVDVPLIGVNEVDLSDLVACLAQASGFEIAPPESGVRLPVTGVAGRLGRKTLADTLGPRASIGVEGRRLVVQLDPAVLEPGGRADWEQRIRELAARSDRETLRRRNYGLHGRPSYQPNNPSRPTVCLLHGVNSSSRGFVHTIPPMEEAGYGVVVYDYPFNRDIEETCRQFALDWAAFRRKVGEDRPWAIVAHSMGALVARSYVEGPSYGSDVSTLILIAPVNQGSSLAKTQTLMQLFNGIKAVNGLKSADALAHLGDGLGEAADDMSPGSEFLKALNARPRRKGVAYHILAGDSAFVPPEVRRQIDRQVSGMRGQTGLFGGLARLATGDDLPDRLDEVTDGKGDGCVSVARTRLDGVTDHVVIHANHAELIRAPLLFTDPGPVACMPDVLRWLGKPAPR